MSYTMFTQFTSYTRFTECTKVYDVIEAVNEKSLSEKHGGSRPPHWEMVFWWTRKPLVGARATILASLLPDTVEPVNFLRMLGGKPIGSRNVNGSPHRFPPVIPEIYEPYVKGKKLLDPFAGFGSIPLEAMRLGLEVTAAELLPTAYIFLKAVLDYPASYGKQLIRDVKKWGEWVTERLKEDKDLYELYDETAVYIGSWEVKCPHCGKWTPIVGNWWLARVKKGKRGYQRLAFFRPFKEGDGVKIEVVDLNAVHRDVSKAKVDAKSGKIEIGVEKYEVPRANVYPKGKRAWCLYCGMEMRFVDAEGNHFSENGKRSDLEWYIKWALKKYNEGDDKFARPRLLVKVKVVSKELKFEPAIEGDNEKLWRALEKLKQMWGDPDIPTEPIAFYENRRITPVLGADKFYKLFNPRQLLTLVKLVKLIREAGKRVEEEKLKEGWSREEAFKYAEAVATYLAITLARFVDHNNIVTLLHPSNPMGIEIAHALSTRGIAMMWNWGDTNPFITTKGTLRTNSWIKCLEKVAEGLSYLLNTNSGSSSKVSVLLDDATVLSKLNDEKFDLIVTDPPYRDDVPYAELSDFYYVWLKRALSDDNLAPRFHSDTLIYNTQWESFSLNEISYNEGRLKYFGVEDTEDYYEKLMGMAFRRMSELLKDDGLIVTYFAHSSPDAWIELIEAGWKRASLRVTRAWALSTESEQRVTARGKTALESSVVVVWRKRGKDCERVGEYVDVYREAFEKAGKAKEEALRTGLSESDLFLATMLGALSTFTSYDKVIHFGRELTPRDVVRESYAIATRITANATEAIKSPEALFYLASKSIFRLYSKPAGQTTLPGFSAEPIVLSSHDVIILSYGFLRELEKAEKEGYKLFERGGIIRSIKEVGGAEVAKQKAFSLLEPLNPTIEGLKRVLGERGVNPIKMEAEKRDFNSIDALHLLEYFAKQGISEFKIAYQNLYEKYPNQVREAVEMAKVISGYSGDPESDLAKLVRDHIGSG